MYVHNNLNSISVVFTCFKLRIWGVFFSFERKLECFMNINAQTVHNFLNNPRTAYMVFSFTSVLKIS